MQKMIFGILLFFGLIAKGYIPSARMILDRVTENAFKTPLYVEQEITLTSSGQSVHLREHWLFENENSMRLLVSGDKDLKDQITFLNLYTGAQRTTSLMGSVQSAKASKPLLEKVFFIKNTENLMKFLVSEGIVTDEIFQSQNFKKPSGNNGAFQYQPESFLRLGRISGGVAYVFGPKPQADNIAPGFWVQQDFFNIMKLRNAGGDEIRVEKIASYSRGARWPKELTYTWSSGASIASQAQVQVVTVRLAETQHRQIFLKNGDKRSPEFEKSPGRALIEEFYSRFR